MDQAQGKQVAGGIRAFCHSAGKWNIVRNALQVSLVVGTLLNLINQGGQLLQGSGVIWHQLLLNYLVPYCVATYSAARNDIRRDQQP